MACQAYAASAALDQSVASLVALPRPVVRSYTTTARQPSTCGPRSRHAVRCPKSHVPSHAPTGTPPMKIILWIIFIIFLIGLAVVLGLGKLIF